MRHSLSLLVVVAVSAGVVSALAAQRAPSVPDRHAILDAVRPLAAARAKQPVRIVVTRLNQVGDWAVLVGSLVDRKGRSLDWARASECEPDLDKHLWATVQRVQHAWRVRELAVCAPEPPYWDPSFVTHTAVPCDVLRGLIGADGVDLTATCRRIRRAGVARGRGHAQSITP